MKNFLQIFHMVLPILGLLVPGSAPYLPLIQVGVDEAASIPGATGEQKRAHVINIVAAGAAAVSTTGKVVVDPEAAAGLAAGVIKMVDGIKDTHQTVVEQGSDLNPKV